MPQICPAMPLINYDAHMGGTNLDGRVFGAEVARGSSGSDSAYTSDDEDSGK